MDNIYRKAQGIKLLSKHSKEIISKELEQQQGIVKA